MELDLQGFQNLEGLFIFKLDDPLLEEILSVNIDTLTPIEVLMKLNEINRMIVGKS